MASGSATVINVNVGGILYTSTVETLTKEEGSVLHTMFAGGGHASLLTDSKGRVFIDRDGVLFRYILDYLRNDRLLLPDNFQEAARLRVEAEHFRLGGLLGQLGEAGGRLGADGWSSPSLAARVSYTGGPAHSKFSCLPPALFPAAASRYKGHQRPKQFRALASHVSRCPLYNYQSAVLHKKRPSATDMSGAGGGEGYIVVGYRGTFAFGRDMSDVKFRKLSRILVCGKVKMCREVFKESLNESRDPDRGLDSDRYTARFFLKHTLLEQAFDQLCVAGFRMVGSCGSGTSAPSDLQDIKPGQFQVQIEDQWNHYNEFVFLRSSPPGCICSPVFLGPQLPISQGTLTPED